MKLIVNVHGLEITIPCGNGNQTIKWLSLAASQRYALATPHGRCRAREDAHLNQGLYLPSVVMKAKTGDILEPTSRITDKCEDGEMITVRLHLKLVVDDIGSPQFSSWATSAFFHGQSALSRGLISLSSIRGNNNREQQKSSTTSKSPKHVDSYTKDDDENLNELKKYAQIEYLQHIKSGRYLTESEYDAAFNYDWSCIHIELIIQDAKERNLLHTFLLNQFQYLNAIYRHYTVGANEISYGMNGHELMHFLQETTIINTSKYQRALEDIYTQCFQFDDFVLNQSLSRTGFQHSLLQVLAFIRSQTIDKKDASNGTLVKFVENAFQKYIVPTIKKLTSGPIRDILHYDQVITLFIEARPKLTQLYNLYSANSVLKKTERIRKQKEEIDKNNEYQETDISTHIHKTLMPHTHASWPQLLSVDGLYQLICDCGLFYAGDVDAQEEAFQNAVNQAYGQLDNTLSREDQYLVFAECIEVLVRLTLAFMTKNDDGASTINAIATTVGALRRLSGPNDIILRK